MPDTLTMDQAAAEVGLSRERFRKVWRTWMRELGFPAPFKTPRIERSLGERPRAFGCYAWRASAVAEWKARREAALGAGRDLAPAANENPPPPRKGSPEARRLSRERAELAQLMRRA